MKPVILRSLLLLALIAMTGRLSIDRVATADASDGASDKKTDSRHFHFPDDASGSCRAVSVAIDAPLIHTGQVLPLNDDGSVFAPGSARTQVRRAFENLAKVLVSAHSDLNHVVKLNVYVADASVSPEVHRYLGGVFSGGEKPAVTFVAMHLPCEGALIAVDAVAVDGGGCRRRRGEN